MDVKIFANNPDQKAVNQVYELAKLDAFKDAKIRVMPDVHAGAGCVIGFTADLGDKVIPNVVGVDIGCGMLVVELGKIDIDLEQFDRGVRKYIPSGFNVHEEAFTYEPLEKLHVYKQLRKLDHIQKSLGTLGGGNHFIEIGEGSDGNRYLIIHSGSRNLGKQVADIYQKLAIRKCSSASQEARVELINKLKAEGNTCQIEEALRTLPRPIQVPNHLAYLEGEDKERYLHDMRICQEYATVNRMEIAFGCLRALGEPSNSYNSFSTVHNYIDEDNMVRKGAISARKDELVLIPMNMRDGSLLCKGKGNKDWNCSAPHGAGRLMSRREAKEKLNMEDFTETMKDVYTTSVTVSTLDESPMAYKPMQEIIDAIGDTVEIVDILKPLYNFKAEQGGK